MRKKEYSTGYNSEKNFKLDEVSIINEFIYWFRNFLDSSE